MLQRPSPLPDHSPLGGLDEKSALLREYTRTRDIRIRNRLVLKYERLVRSIARRFGTIGGNTHEDLVQVGYLGLIVAIERFDPRGEAGFVTYATPTIVGVIKRYLRDQSWLVKTPRRLRELGIGLRKVSARLEHRLGRPPTPSELAEAAGVDEERLLRALDLDRAYQPASLDAHQRPAATDARPSTGRDTLGALDPALLAVEDRESVRLALEQLDQRERTIIRHRFFGEASQKEVATHLGISQMHVSRLERRALQRLRSILA